MAAAQLAATVFSPDNPPIRFTALVSNYASCVFQWGPYTHRSQLLQRKIDTPILMLMAANDFELRASDCFPQLEEMKGEQQPVEWHVYADGYHAWDQPGVKFSITNGFGTTTQYSYNSQVTADATARMLEFFNRHR